MSDNRYDIPTVFYTHKECRERIMVFNPIGEEFQHSSCEGEPIKAIPHLTMTIPYNPNSDDPYGVVLCDGEKTVALQIDPLCMDEVIQWLKATKQIRHAIQKVIKKTTEIIP